uniref:Uncharacterized protein n=1 Tax=Human betaherpesvirus 6 TaxID=10368 RepID=A0A5P9S8A7_9BETA|nr:hypothetical protein [Human betaherpesvirus 6]
MQISMSKFTRFTEKSKKKKTQIWIIKYLFQY